MNERDAIAWMSRLIDRPNGNDKLPDPGLIWWKARLLEKREAQARVARPMAIAQWFSLAIAIIAAAVLCAFNWGDIYRLMAPFGIALWLIPACAILTLGAAIRFFLPD